MSDNGIVIPTSTVATLHDVAREAGVSLATASRVLNGSTRKVADAYRERVEAAAEMLGYTANLSAQAIARGTGATLALLVADIADPYFGQIAAGVARRAEEAGVVVTIAVTERDAERELRLLRALRGQRPRGVILAASRAIVHGTENITTELANLAASGTQIAGLGPGGSPGRWIAVDNFGGAAQLAAGLIERGYRRAIILGAAAGVRTSDERIAGFTEAFTTGGGEIADVRRGGFSREGGERMMLDAFGAGVPQGTLVFGISDVVAIGAMRAIRDSGRTVGADIALCGFDDIPTSTDVSPSLSTVHIPLESVGYQAASATLEPDWNGPGEALDLTVVLRDSTPGISA